MKLKIEDSNKLVEEILNKSLNNIGEIIVKKSRLLLEGHVGGPTELSKTIKHKVKGRDVIIFSDNKILGFIERGTDPHIIKPKKPGGSLAFRAESGGVRKNKTTFAMGDKIYTKKVRHPGTEAKPTLSAALFLSKPEIIKELQQVFKAPTLVSKGSGQ